MSPFASWCALGALIFLFFTFLWLLSGEPHDGESVDEEEGWLDEG